MTETALSTAENDVGGARYRPPAFLVAFMLFLIADCFSGNTAFALPVAPERILFGLAALLLLIDARTKWHRFRSTPALWVALACVGWIAGSAFLHGTLTQSLGIFALLDRVVVPYVLYFAAPLIFSDRRSRLLLLQVLCGLGIYLGATAIFETAHLQALVWPRYINDLSNGISGGRARGPFLASDANAATMAMCLFAAGALFALSTRRAARMIAVISALVCFIGVLLCLTRAEWIGTGVGLIVAALLVPSLRRWLAAGLAAGAALVGAVLLASPTVRAEVFGRATTVRSVYDRQNTNAGGVRAFEHHPLFGIGWERFLFETTRWVRQTRDYPLTNTNIEIHNVPLSRLAEVGLIGGMLWVLTVFLGPIAAAFVRRRTAAIDEAFRVAFVGMLVVWLIAIQFSPFPYPLPNALIWLVAGIVMAPLSPRLRTTNHVSTGARNDAVRGPKR